MLGRILNLVENGFGGDFLIMIFEIKDYGLLKIDLYVEF